MVVIGFTGDRTLYTFTTTEEENNIHLKLTLKNDLTYTIEEISNYSKPNYYSRHNTNYWKCGQYYGFGLSAHGYDGDIRYSNYSILEEYLNSPISHEYGTFLTDEIKLEERIFLGLRLAEGINIKEINKDFHIDFNEKYKPQLEKYLSTGHLLKTNIGYRLSNNETSNGFLISNLILSDFITSE